jgi:hypothetical protein
MSVSADGLAGKHRRFAVLGALALIASCLMGRCDRPVATAAVAIAGVLGIATSARAKAEAALFDLDWRLAQDEDQIAENTRQLGRAIELLEAAVPGAPSAS